MEQKPSAYNHLGTVKLTLPDCSAWHTLIPVFFKNQQQSLENKEMEKGICPHATLKTWWHWQRVHSDSNACYFAHNSLEQYSLPKYTKVSFNDRVNWSSDWRRIRWLWSIYNCSEWDLKETVQLCRQIHILCFSLVLTERFFKHLLLKTIIWRFIEEDCCSCDVWQFTYRNT